MPQTNRRDAEWSSTAGRGLGKIHMPFLSEVQKTSRQLAWLIISQHFEYNKPLGTSPRHDRVHAPRDPSWVALLVTISIGRFSAHKSAEV